MTKNAGEAAHGLARFPPPEPWPNVSLMSLPMPYRWACIGLVLCGCPDGGNEDESTSSMVPTTDTGPTTGTTQTPGSTLTPSTTTSNPCPEGTLGCPCQPEDMCLDDLECDAGTCRAPQSDTSTGTDGTTTGPAVCGDGNADPGDLCLESTSTPFAMGLGTIAVTAANFDTDPAIDLVTANRDGNSISIRLGIGNGDFGVETEVMGVVSGPIAVGAGDFNGDTNLDVVTANLTTFDMTTIAGDGNGNFGAAAPIVLGDLLVPSDLSVTDLEGDGDPDVLVTESTMSFIHTFRTEMGVFMPVETYPVGMGPSAIHAADFSGDMVPDIVTADATAGSVSLLLGNGLGQLGGATNETAGASPSDVGAGDFNGDGEIDAVVTNPGGNITIRLGNGLGGLSGQLSFPVDGGPVALVATDLDLDGNTDVAVACGDNMVRVLLGNGASTLVEEAVIPVEAQPEDIIAVDLNEDGLLDLVTANLVGNGVSVILTNA